MQAVAFYQMKAVYQHGEDLYLQQVWNYSDQEYEKYHNFIQWVFPTDETSMVNTFAPVITEREIPYFNDLLIMSRLRRSFIQFIESIGLKFKDDQITVQDKVKFHKKVVLRTHNLSRITRVIRSLTILHMKKYAILLLNLLEHEGIDNINPVSYQYWLNAVITR